MIMRLMKNLRILLAVLAFITLVGGLGLPVLASVDGPGVKNIQVTQKVKGRDDPWDPGEESENPAGLESSLASVKNIFTEQISFDSFDLTLLASGRKEDDPWDPGEESGRVPEVRNA